MKQTHCYVVVIIKKHGRPSFAVYMNKQHAMQDLINFDKCYREEAGLREIYEDYYMIPVMIE